MKFSPISDCYETKELMMGRPRKYATDAERQKAFRERKYLDESAQSFEGKRALYEDQQVRWNKVNGFEIYKQVDHVRKAGMLFVVTSGKTVAIHERYYDSEKKEEVFKKHSMPSVAEAERVINEIVEGKEIKWKRASDYLKLAQHYHANYKISDAHVPTITLGFLFALLDANELGYDNHQGSLFYSTEDYRRNRSISREFILNIVGDIDFTEMNRKQVANAIHIAFKSLLGSSRTKRKSLAVATYRIRCQMIIDAISFWENTLDERYPQLLGHIKSLKCELDLLIKTNTLKATTGTSTASGLRNKESYKWIDINHLKEILDIAWATNTEIYHYLILSLTTGLRPEEMKRLVENPLKYMLDDGTFNFKGINLDLNEFLTTKTIGKITPDRLQNPQISVVARIILKNFKPRLEPHDFFGKSAYNFRTQKTHLREYVERSLRTTMGHMLGFCKHAKEHEFQSSLEMVYERMAHVDSLQAIKTYAKSRPSKMSPENYFRFNGYFIDPITKENLTRATPLWDGWLLRDFLLRHKNSSTESEYENLLRLTREESYKYQADIGEREENIESSYA